MEEEFKLLLFESCLCMFIAFLFSLLVDLWYSDMTRVHGY